MFCKFNLHSTLNLIFPKGEYLMLFFLSPCEKVNLPVVDLNNEYAKAVIIRFWHRDWLHAAGNNGICSRTLTKGQQSYTI